MFSRMQTAPPERQSHTRKKSFLPTGRIRSTDSTTYRNQSGIAAGWEAIFMQGKEPPVDQKHPCVIGTERVTIWQSERTS
jgi:hypothetical protein